VESFPNGETFVQIQENIRGADVFVVQPTQEPANHHLMELLIFVDAARRASAQRITAVLPFYGYARQDRKDRPRVPITAKLVANLLVAAGANRVLTVDLHAQQIVGFFDIPVDHLFAHPIFFDYLKRSLVGYPLSVFSPDLGGMKRALAYADFLGCPVGAIAKRRRSAREVEVFHVIGEAKDRHIVLLDDLSETGNTLMTAATRLKAEGAKTVRAVITHGVFSRGALERIVRSDLDEVVTTNTVPVVPVTGYPLHILDISHLLAEAIYRIHNHLSVNELFDVKERVGKVQEGPKRNFSDSVGEAEDRKVF
jgi:ribose-phosphate pyrophosphokinase